MGYIPPYTRTVLPQTAQPGNVSLARAQHDINAQNIEAAGKQAGQIGDILTNYAYREAQARNTTFVNDTVIQAKREAIEGLDTARQGRMASPEGFHKDFDSELEKQHEKLIQTAPSHEARTALRQSLNSMRANVLEDNFGWERQRKVSIAAERVENAGRNLNKLAYTAGTKGGDFNQLIRDAQATTVAASTLIAPEKVATMNKALKQSVITNYLEGLAENDPLAALRRVEDEDIRNHFENIDDYQQMKDAIENRAKAVHEVMAQKEILNTLKDETNLLTQSVGQPLSFTEIEEATANMSVQAREYFMNAHGFSGKEGGQPKLSDAEKISGRAQLYTAIEQMKDQELSSLDVAEFQQTIFEGVNKGVLTDEQGINYINNIVAPLVERKEETLKKYQTGKFNPFEDNLGFSGLKEIFDKDIAVPVEKGTTVAAKKAAAFQTAINNGNKVKLYDYYMQSLGDQAESYGLRIGDIEGLNKGQRQKIYGDAQEQAYRMFLIDKNPVLGTLSDLPNMVLKDGDLIPGAAGKRNLKPDFSAGGGFTIIEKDGHRARRYDNGEIEVLY